LKINDKNKKKEGYILFCDALSISPSPSRGEETTTRFAMKNGFPIETFGNDGIGETFGNDGVGETFGNDGIGDLWLTEYLSE
jgi:hypothetical protein